MDFSTLPLPATTKKPVIAIVLYPLATLIDFANPQAALGLFCDTHLLWKTLDPVPMDSGSSVVPTMTFANCPPDVDVLLVLGGMGSNSAMEDPELLQFVKHCGATARYVTSVCSGCLILGAARLLDGYKAATHWAYYDGLEAMNIEAGRDRVVIDRSRLTGGGVAAGLDFGLALLAILKGEDIATTSQLIMEYDPQPPFHSGHPPSADKQTITAALKIMEGYPEGQLSLARLRWRHAGSPYKCLYSDRFLSEQTARAKFLL